MLKTTATTTFLPSPWIVPILLVTAMVTALTAGPAVDPEAVDLERKLRIDGNYLQLPLLDRDERQMLGVSKFRIEDGEGRVLRFQRLLFAPEGAEPDFWYSADVREFRGREVVLRYRSRDRAVLDRLRFGDEKIVAPDAYDGEFRPRFHFSPRMGWMNDVNGTHYHDGLYHLFYQSNPTMTGVSTGFDMHWGHSVSRDLVHWEEWPIGLHPDADGNIFSGTAMLLEERIEGISDTGPLPRPLLFYTGTTPHSQRIASSNDGGRYWQRFPGNPVVPNMGVGDRDPKVFRHDPSGHYVMILFVGQPRTYRVLISKDLKKWEQTSVLPGWSECPEFLPVRSPTTGEDLWLLYGGYNSEAFEDPPVKLSSAYQLGRFDGRTFTPVTPIRRAHRGPNFYAAITFAGEPKGRHLMMGWTAGAKFPGEPFNGCATVPLRMSLRRLGGADVLCYEPAAELAALRGEPILRLAKTNGRTAMEKLAIIDKKDTLDVTLRLAVKQEHPVEVTIGRNAFRFDPTKRRLVRQRDGKPADEVQLHPEGAVEARFLIDRSIIESFWNRGEAAFSVASLHTDPGPAMTISESAVVDELVIYPMRPAK